MGVKKKNLAIALSGGSVRGLAHIGFLEVLEEHHVPIDFIAGTSMGALVGGLYSAGKLREFKNEIVKLSKNRFLTLLFSNRIKKGKADIRFIENRLKKYIGTKKIEELDIPFTSIATDLRTGKEVFIEKGNLLQAIMASVALPGIFEPVKIKNMLLVDGGVIDPLPEEYCEAISKKTISVNAMPALFSFKKDSSKFDIISEAAAILTGQLISKRKRNTKKNLFIQFRTKDIASFDLRHAERVIKIGRKAAKKNIKKILKFVKG